MFRRTKDINYQPYIMSNDFYYSPQTGMYMPINTPQDERFGGLLLPALGGFLVGSLIPAPWTPRPMYPPQPYMNTYSGYGYQTMMPYPTTPINSTNPQ